MIEGHANFTLFDIKNETYCFDIGSLFSDIMDDSVMSVYDFYNKNHTISQINEGIPGELSMESYFFARIEILKRYFSDLLSGKLKKYEQYFEPLKGGYINMFNDLKVFVEKIEKGKNVLS